MLQPVSRCRVCFVHNRPERGILRLGINLRQQRMPATVTITSNTLASAKQVPQNNAAVFFAGERLQFAIHRL